MNKHLREFLAFVLVAEIALFAVIVLLTAISGLQNRITETSVVEYINNSTGNPSVQVLSMTTISQDWFNGHYKFTDVAGNGEAWCQSWFYTPMDCILIVPMPAPK